jgi:hypothetical protein
VLNLGSSCVGGFAQVGFELDRLERSVRVVLQMAKVQGEGEIWRRFGGGSDRNRALLSKRVNSMHDMRSVQSRINTGCFASC